MSRRHPNREPGTAIALAGSIAVGGLGYVAGKYIEGKRRTAEAEKVEAHLIYQATHDELTGELNKRGLEKLLSENKPPRALLYADSTKLKEVNDRLGHARGDEAIIATGQVLRKSLRPGDILARTGGDEFLVLLDPSPQVDPSNQVDPERRANQDRSPSELLTYVTSRVGQETQELLGLPENADLLMAGFDVAVGGAVWERGMSIDDLRAEADTAMYKAKEAQHASNGGNTR